MSPTGTEDDNYAVLLAEIERLKARVEWYDKLDLERISEIGRLRAILEQARKG